MPIHGMAAQIEPERFLLVGQPLHLGPGGPVGPQARRPVRCDGRRGLAEEIRLALLAVALHAGAVLDGGVDGRA